ncbi:MAG: hypothetical protein U5N26_04610 [Candidatus Marinimicrobia bacterium]|nr:hypothetical protein [Candidatus Neomarinimicrobiota bacterium]
MKEVKRVLACFPATDPYLGTVTVQGSLPANMVDWVLVELRESASGATIAQAVGCLLSDGSVTDTTGTNGLSFEGLESSTPYYIVVRHRNHLSVMSASAVQIDGTNDADEFDFTAGNAYGNTGDLAMKPVGSEYAMYAGDANENGQVQTTDKNSYWNNETGKAGYLPSDFNLNGQSQTTDINNYWRINVGKGSQVPIQ